MNICKDFAIRDEEEVPVALLFRHFFNMEVPIWLLHEVPLYQLQEMYSLPPEQMRFIYAALLLRRAMVTPSDYEHGLWYEDFVEAMCGDQRQ